MLAWLAAPAAFGDPPPPPPDFTWAPLSPLACQQVDFTPSLDAVDPMFDYDTGTPEAALSHTFMTEGTHPVTMTTTNGPPVSHDVVVQNAPPIAAFSYSPTQPDPDEWIVFDSTTSSDCDDSVKSYAWDFHDGTTSDEPKPVHKFTAAGSHDVTLTVTDQDGATDVETVAVPVFRANAAPVAGFVWTPISPVAGSEVQLYSTSVDAEGPLASEAWDLDGDGQFDDAAGPSAVQTFTAGDHQVSLQVTDGDGVSRTIARTITVAAPVIPAGPSPAAAVAPALMKPFPTVRLVGVVLPRGARITFVEVRGGPRGARVTVRCTGKGCPFRSRRLVAETGRVRLSDFKRVLAAGTRIEVFVRAPNVIGRYVAFRIRAAKPPLRADRCLMPGASEPTRCT